MRFVPQKLKDLFPKRSESTPYVSPDPLNELKPFLQENGSYLFDLHVGKEDKGLLINSPHMRGFNIYVEGSDELAPVNFISTSVGVSASLNFGMRDAGVFFKKKSEDLYVNGKDQTIGLPPGDGYQIVLIPASCEWRPAAKPAETAPKDTCPVLRAPGF